MKYIILTCAVVLTLFTGCVTAPKMPAIIEDVQASTDTYDRTITYIRVEGVHRVLRVATTNNNEVVITPANLIGNVIVERNIRAIFQGSAVLTVQECMELISTLRTIQSAVSTKLPGATFQVLRWRKTTVPTKLRPLRTTEFSIELLNSYARTYTPYARSHTPTIIVIVKNKYFTVIPETVAVLIEDLEKAIEDLEKAIE